MILVVAGLIAAGRSFKVVQQYKQSIIFRFRKVLSRPRGAGLILIRPVGDRMQKVSMQIAAMTFPAQDGITKDNVTVRVDVVPRGNETTGLAAMRLEGESWPS